MITAALVRATPAGGASSASSSRSLLGQRHLAVGGRTLVTKADDLKWGRLFLERNLETFALRKEEKKLPD